MQPDYEHWVLWAPREDNSDAEYEDSVAVAATGDRAVIADGASQGIFSRTWADLLTQRWLQQPPDVADRQSLTTWILDAGSRWRELIRYAELSSLHQDKVERIGTGATLLALNLQPDEDDGHLWRATAVGDCCLFCVRHQQLLLTFPMKCSADFSDTPTLIPTIARFAPEVQPVIAEGKGEPGDLYLLATDAVAQYLLQCHEAGQAVWRKFWKLPAQDWRHHLHQLRASRQIVDDDSTLVLVSCRVSQC